MKSLFLLLLTTLKLTAVSLWSEGFTGQGDLSNDYLNPNRFTLTLGSNTISADISSNPATGPDFFTLTVPPGLQVSGIFLLGYDFPVAGNQSFIGFQDGATLRQAPELFTASSSTQISHTLFGTSDVTNNFDPFNLPATSLLDDFTEGTFSSSGPLTPGEYAFWVNEIEPQNARFTLNFITTEFVPIPEPSVGLLALTFTGLFGFSHRRRPS